MVPAPTPETQTQRVHFALKIFDDVAIQGEASFINAAQSKPSPGSVAQQAVIRNFDRGSERWDHMCYFGEMKNALGVFVLSFFGLHECCIQCQCRNCISR
jgi:hypothetical protein